MGIPDLVAGVDGGLCTGLVPSPPSPTRLTQPSVQEQRLRRPVLFTIATWQDSRWRPLWGAYGGAVGGWVGAEAPWCFRCLPAWLGRSAGWRERTDGVGDEQHGDADRLAAAAEQVEAGRGPVAVARPGHQPVVLVSAEERQRLEELESAESTAWWRRDAGERAASGEEPGSGEDGPGLDEAAFRRRSAHLFPGAGAA